MKHQHGIVFATLGRARVRSLGPLDHTGPVRPFGGARAHSGPILGVVFCN